MGWNASTAPKNVRWLPHSEVGAVETRGLTAAVLHTGLGNIMLLCAANLYPDPKIYLGFAMCLIKDYQHIPQRGHFEDCALEHAIDFDQLSDCASQDDGAFGVDMLRNSVRRSAEVRYSQIHRLQRHF